jgi:hypothetical protein
MVKEDASDFPQYVTDFISMKSDEVGEGDGIRIREERMEK